MLIEIYTVAMYEEVMGGGSHVAEITGNILTEKGNLAFCAS